MSGKLDLGGFLTHRPDRSGGGWLKNWKEAGGVELWLHQLAPIYFHWHHVFVAPDVVEDKDGKPRRILTFPRFTCWEPERVCSNQYFENDNKTGRRFPPTSCPFCLLRDWLRWGRDAADIPLTANVFAWDRPPPTGRQQRQQRTGPIEWQRGFLAGLEKRGSNWDVTIDAKLRYIFTVVEHPSSPTTELSVVLADAPKALGQSVQELINDQIRSRGEDEGNPLINPYCIRWEFHQNEVAQKMYKAIQWPKNHLTAAIREALNGEYPDASGVVGFDPAVDGPKIRAMMEIGAENAGMQLPWDILFPDGSAKPPAGSRKAASDRGATETHQRARTPEVGRQERQDAPIPPKRRRLQEPPPPPPPPKEPEPERIPCDQCGHPMLPTEAECAKCGARYEIDADEPAPPPTPPKRPTQAATPAEPTRDDGTIACWACGKNRPNTSAPCPHCNVQPDDDIPF